MKNIFWKGQPLGEHGLRGKTIEKTRFLALPKVERLRAYLLIAWPHARKASLLSRLCDVRTEDIANFLKPDLRDGVIVRLRTGYYVARPIVQTHIDQPPIHEAIS